MIQGDYLYKRLHPKHFIGQDNRVLKYVSEPVTVKTETLENSFTKGELQSHIRKVFAPKGIEAVNYALFLANCESRYNYKHQNMNDDHTSWCKGDKGIGSHGLFQYNKCSYEKLGGKDIYNPLEQIELTAKEYPSNKWMWKTCTNLYNEAVILE